MICVVPLSSLAQLLLVNHHVRGTAFRHVCSSEKTTGFQTHNLIYTTDNTENRNLRRMTRTYQCNQIHCVCLQMFKHLYVHFPRPLHGFRADRLRRLLTGEQTLSHKHTKRVSEKIVKMKMIGSHENELFEGGLYNT